MQPWTAFVLGIVGSLHCAAMCGPLALALPPTGATPLSFVAGRAAYNAGRILTYCILGAVLGLMGQALALAGLQRWLSLSLGAMILLASIAPSRFTPALLFTRRITWLKSRFLKMLQQRSIYSLFLLGAFNGLLPCGLVYAACAAAVTTGRFLPSLQYMLGFGLGTLPLMLGISLVRKAFPSPLRLRFQRLIPASFFLVGFLLVLRGLPLGIPYLSPSFSGHCPHCPSDPPIHSHAKTP